MSKSERRNSEHSSNDLFVYISWKTHEGKPVLADDQIRQAVYLAVITRTRALMCRMQAISGTCNQVHFILRFPASLPVSLIARLAMEAASASALQISNVLYARPSEDVCLWEKHFTSQTLSAEEAAQAQAYLQRKLHETQQSLCPA